MGRKDELTEIDGAMVRSRREALGMSRADVAGPSGVSQSTWEAIERGYRPQFAARTVTKVLGALDRLELEREGDAPVSMTSREFALLLREVAELRRAVAALEDRQPPS